MCKNKVSEDLSGIKFGRLTALERVCLEKSKVYWKCVCECGSITNVNSYNLKSGHTKSCGCLRIEKSKKNTKTHGYSHEHFYNVWRNILKRCNNKNCKAYKNYGGRGIKVCAEWLDLENFKKWAINNNFKKGLEIDRIDNNGDYEPNNCRFVTHFENNKSGRKRTKVGKSGISGVYKTPSGRWCARFTENYKEVHVGTFDSPEEATKAREKLMKERGCYAD